MKILVVGDLHSRSQWFSWISEQVPHFDLVALPGDFLDIFGGDLEGQKNFMTKWFAGEAAKSRPLAWCSGNHDVTRWSQPQPDPRPEACWTDRLRFDWVVGDLETKALLDSDGESFLVSSIPYCDLLTETWEKTVEKMLWQAQATRDELGCPWIVLAHNPPADTPVAETPEGSGGSGQVRLWMERFQPDFLFSGHLHQAPFLGNHLSAIDNCLCIHPGHVPHASVPSHVTIDTADGAVVFVPGI